MTKKLGSLEKVSEKTTRTKRLWLKGKKEDLPVYRIPTKHLYFNIENGRYADKMLQLKTDNPGVDVDPKVNKWKTEIFKMLKGDYTGNIELEGTESDRIDFERLSEDIKNREQLEPGVVLADGGVVDGNRRLAVLMSLKSPKFDYFEGVILPEDIPAEDRWRIEVGIQMGKDPQLEYSRVNKVLKIRQGLELFRAIKLALGKTPEDMVADSMYGVSRKEIADEIALLNLINQYLDFFKMSGQYHRVGNRSERLIEVLNAIRAAEGKLKPHEMAKFKSSLFVVVRENIMNNWEIRNFSRALGGRAKSPGKKSKPIEKAVDHFIAHSTDPKMVVDAYSKNKQTKLVEKSKNICDEFKDIFDAEKEANRPLTLAKDAHTKLATLNVSLKKFKKPEDFQPIKKELIAIKKLVKACHNTLHNVKKK